MEDHGNMSDKELSVSENEVKEVHGGILALMSEETTPLYMRIEKFRTLIDRAPKKELVKDHPYLAGVKYLPISHVEGIMDTLYFRQWGTRNFEHRLLGNEIVGTIELWFIDPITQREITRIGAGSIQVMVDTPTKLKDMLYKCKDPDEKIELKKQINFHALDLQNNKKPNSLEASFPKLKTQCFKNACRTIGKIFGKDLNRGEVHVPVQLIPENYDSVANILK